MRILEVMINEKRTVIGPLERTHYPEVGEAPMLVRVRSVLYSVRRPLGLSGLQRGDRIRATIVARAGESVDGLRSRTRRFDQIRIEAIQRPGNERRYEVNLV